MQPVLFLAINTTHETRKKKQKKSNNNTVKQTEREITTKGRLQEKNRKPKRQEHNTNEEAPRQESANIKQVQNVSILTIKCMK